MNLPPEILTILLSALPIGEIRASIPVAIVVYKMSVFQAVLWSLLGSFIGSYLLLKFIDPAVKLLSKHIGFLERFFNWIFEKTRDRAVKKYTKYGQWALILFVAVPLPGSGFWTGAIIAYLFDIPKNRALLLIITGLILCAVLVVLATLGIFSFF